MKRYLPLPSWRVTAWAATLVLYFLALAWAMLQRWLLGRPAYPFWLEASAHILTYTAIGALILTRRPGNLIGWLFTILGLGNALSFFTGQYATASLVAQGSELPGGAVAALVSLLATNGSVYGFVALLLLFPTGRLPSHRWRPAAWLIVVGLAYEWAISSIKQGPIGPFPMLENLFGMVDADTFAQTPIGTFLGLLLPLALVGSIVSLFVRFWYAHGQERQQLKWFAFATPLGISLLLLPGLVFPGLSNVIPLSVVWALAPLGPPIAAAIAITRYRLYDIDVIIRRTLIYTLLSATLALVYLGSVVVLQRLLAPLTGESNQVAVVVSTLAIAALFHPLRRRIQAAIDRRFYRRKYDAARTLQAFNARVRDQVEMSTLTDDVLDVVQNTLQPAHVSIWLRPTRRN